jgi:hypothetical protein
MLPIVLTIIVVGGMGAAGYLAYRERNRRHVISRRMFFLS